jgi:hypothetical protein
VNENLCELKLLTRTKDIQSELKLVFPNTTDIRLCELKLFTHTKDIQSELKLVFPNTTDKAM